MGSETSFCRPRLAHYCTGCGLDIGYGGDPICPSAITVDLPRPYSNAGTSPLNLGGDARDLLWFRDNTLDYVYSSHLLEDFPAWETRYILCEWLRVLRPGGHLVLYLPDEQRYRAHCRTTGHPHNPAHSVVHFSLVYMTRILRTIPCTRIVHAQDECECYSFELVVTKTKPCSYFLVRVARILKRLLHPLVTLVRRRNQVR